jgi:hypothetical protein
MGKLLHCGGGGGAELGTGLKCLNKIRSESVHKIVQCLSEESSTRTCVEDPVAAPYSKQTRSFPARPACSLRLEGTRHINRNTPCNWFQSKGADASIAAGELHEKCVGGDVVAQVVFGLFLEETQQESGVKCEAAQRHVVPGSAISFAAEKAGNLAEGAHVLRSVVFVKTAVRPSRGERFQDWEGTSKCAGHLA